VTVLRAVLGLLGLAALTLVALLGAQTAEFLFIHNFTCALLGVFFVEAAVSAQPSGLLLQTLLEPTPTPTALKRAEARVTRLAFVVFAASLTTAASVLIGLWPEVSGISYSLLAFGVVMLPATYAAGTLLFTVVPLSVWVSHKKRIARVSPPATAFDRHVYPRLLGAIPAFGLLLAAVLVGSPLSLFIEPVGILVVFGGGALIWWATSGPRIRHLVTTLGTDDATSDNVAVAQRTLREGRRAVWLMGGSAAVIAFLQVLLAVDSLAVVCASISIGVLRLLYALLVELFLYGPLNARLERLALPSPPPRHSVTTPSGFSRLTSRGEHQHRGTHP